MSQKPNVFRSRLIIPINVEKFVKKANKRNADVIVLDLEDSIPVNEKTQARNLIPSVLSELKKTVTPIYIRVNADAEIFFEDMQKSLQEEVSGIVLPKVESKEDIIAVDKLVTKIEKERNFKEGKFKISILIETAKGFLNMEEILSGSDRIDTISLGMEDLATNMKFTLNEQTSSALNYLRMKLLIVAKAYNVLPLGTVGSISNYTELDKYKEGAQESFQMGFVGSSCIHPNQVNILNESFHFTDKEIKEAKDIVNIFEDALHNGRASTSYRGKMIDYPHYEKYKDMISRHEEILKFESLKKE